MGRSGGNTSRGLETGGLAQFWKDNLIFFKLELKNKGKCFFVLH